MDGFSFFGGLGSLIAAGLCYSTYRNMQDAASHLRVGRKLCLKDDQMHLTGFDDCLINIYDLVLIIFA
jgi:glycosylphosphatidylinositol transamidase (GPIT) subunit GPI8